MNERQTLRPTPGPARGERLDRFFDGIRAGGLYRRRDHRWIGGVCSGVATRLNVDPVLVRIAAGMAGLFFGVGVTVYLLAWLLLPDDGGTIHAERAWKQRHPASIALAVITAFSVLNVDGGPGRRDHGGGGGILGLAITIGLWFWVTKRTAAPPPPPSGPVATQQPYGAPAAVRPADRPAERHAYPQDRRVGEPGASGSTSASSAAPPAWTPPRPAYATTRRSNRRPTGGPFVLLLTIGLSVLAYQAAQVAALTARVPGSSHLIGLSAVAAVLGVILLLLGLSGRRGGLISVAASLTALALAGGSFGLAGSGVRIDAGWGETTWRPASVTDLRPQYEWTAGDAVLDLTAIGADALRGKHTEVDVGMGELTVIVPKTADVEVDAKVTRGRLTWDTDNGGKEVQEASNRSIASERTYAGAAGAKNPLTIDADLRLGDLRIERR